MKATVLAALLCVIAASEAYAADLGPPGPPVAARYAPAPHYDWSGFYIGVNAGYGFGQSSWGATGFTTDNFNTNGAVAGGTIGINYQAQQFVFGFEADADWSGLNGSSSNAYCSLITTGGACKNEELWIGTVRGRVGYAFGRLLVFGTAGGAMGTLNTGLAPPGTFDTSQNFGWTAGGGLEAAITGNWSAKVEYLYTDFGNGICSVNCGLLVPITVPLTASLVRAGINYRLPF